MKSLLLAALFFFTIASARATPRAFYEVPVEKELSPYAKYEIGEFGKKIKGDTIELSYVLPLELTGIPQEVKFSGKIIDERGAIELKGERGDMLCSKGTNDNADHSCSVKYHDIKVDLDEVAKILDSTRVSPEARVGKLHISGLFAAGGGDIGGIISYVYDHGHSHDHDHGHGHGHGQDHGRGRGEDERGEDSRRDEGVYR